jgi:PAS domain-containing protein
VSETLTTPGPQVPVELILLRQVASYLAMPIVLVGAEGDLLYFTEPAESLLGLRFDDVGELSIDEWLAAFRPAQEDGSVMKPQAVPLVVALREQRPTHERLTIIGLDGVQRVIETTSFPLRGQGDRLLGAIALFWPVP